MTIDERLEALTHSLELWSHMQMDAAKEYEGRFRELEKLFRANEERFRANEERVAQLMDTMNRLGRIIEIHDQEIDDHGRHLDNLESQ